MARTTAQLDGATLVLRADDASLIALDTPAWFVEIASGKSNAEVVRTLVIAISMVKPHTNSIFGKLQVTSRTQAIALARDLQLL